MVRLKRRPTGEKYKLFRTSKCRKKEKIRENEKQHLDKWTEIQNKYQWKPNKNKKIFYKTKEPQEENNFNVGIK
jgi:hypothetical protein